MRFFGLLALIALSGCNYSDSKSEPPVASPTAEPATDVEWLFTNLFQPKCSACHGSARQDGGWAFDTQDKVVAATQNGGFVAGNAASGTVSHAITSGSMPPSGGVTSVQLAVLNCWIAGNLSTTSKACWTEHVRSVSQ